jgi:hypothetical protein
MIKWPFNTVFKVKMRQPPTVSMATFDNGEDVSAHSTPPSSNACGQ